MSNVMLAFVCMVLTATSARADGLSGAIKRYDWMLGTFAVTFEGRSNPDGTSPKDTYGPMHGSIMARSGPGRESIIYDHKASGFIFLKPECASNGQPSKSCPQVGTTTQDSHVVIYWDKTQRTYKSAVWAIDAPGVQLSDCKGETDSLTCSSIQSDDGKWYQFITKYEQRTQGFDVTDSVRVATSEGELLAAPETQTSVQHNQRRK